MKKEKSLPCGPHIPDAVRNRSLSGTHLCNLCVDTRWLVHTSCGIVLTIPTVRVDCYRWVVLWPMQSDSPCAAIKCGGDGVAAPKKSLKTNMTSTVGCVPSKSPSGRDMAATMNTTALCVEISPHETLLRNGRRNEKT